MFTCTVFQNAFFFSFLFFSLLIYVWIKFCSSSPRAPNPCAFCPDFLSSFPFSCFIASSADVTSLTARWRGPSVPWQGGGGGCGRLGVVVASSVLKDALESKRGASQLLKVDRQRFIKNQEDFNQLFKKKKKMLLWPKRRSAGWRYIYYTLSAQNLFTSWWLCQGELNP